MIIKSLGRKSGGRYGRSGRGVNPFLALARYMNRDVSAGKGRAILWHNFYGSERTTEAEIVQTFEANGERLEVRKNGNLLYHEILAFSEGSRLQGENLLRAIADIGQEYLRKRAPDQLGYGVVHQDTDHIHLHLMVSANAVGRSDRVRLSKAEFGRVTREVEDYLLTRYPELAQSRVIAKPRDQEKAKASVHEKAQKLRTGRASRKDLLKGQLHSLFERSRSRGELERDLAAAGFSLYVRGKNTGVMVQEADGTERKHRFETLGVAEHYQKTLERFRVPEPSKQAHQDEKGRQDMAAGKNFTQNKSILGTAEIEELVTGKLSPENHGPLSPEPADPFARPPGQVERAIHELVTGKDPGKGVPSDPIEARIRELEAIRKRRKSRDRDEPERWEKLKQGGAIILPGQDILFSYFNMNSYQAKQIPLVEFLGRLGHTPAKVHWADHWFTSPFRPKERTPSFKVDLSKNVWFDHGLGQGGTIIDLVQHLYQTENVSRALSLISDVSGGVIRSLDRPNFVMVQKNKPELESMKPITNSRLEHYIANRAIPLDLARLYLKEARYRVDGRSYQALAFPNDAGGYELRSPVFKGTLGTKAISFLPWPYKPDIGGISRVFEGSFDFLSNLADFKQDRFWDGNVLVLNSLSFLDRGMERIERAHAGEGRDPQIWSYLDRDKAGQGTTEKVLARFPHAVDMSDVYDGFKDYSEYWTAKVIGERVRRAEAQARKRELDEMER